MKTTITKSVLVITVLFFSHQINAQNIGINGTGANAHASALLDVDATGSLNKGLLVPRIPLTAINAAAPVTSPATSLLVYNTASASTGTNAVSPGYYYWDGAKWVRFAYTPSGSSSEAWTTLGNAGTTPTTNFLGTTDAQDLVFRTNNLEAVRITTAGNVGIGTIAPNAKLHVNSTVTVPGANFMISNTNFTGQFLGLYQVGAGSWNPANNGNIQQSIVFSNDGNVNSSSGGLSIVPHATITAGIHIMENGLVGIGKDNPVGKLDIDLTDNESHNLVIYDPNIGNNFINTPISRIANRWYNNEMASIDFWRKNSSNDGEGISLNTSESSSITPISRLYVENNGNVGINTTTPGAKLEIQDNGNRRTLHVNHIFNGLMNTDAAFIGGTDVSYSSTGLFVLQKDNISFGSTGTNLINVVSNSVSQMLINGAGNMGLGTATPSLKLHLHDAGQNFHALRFTSGVSQANFWDIVKRGDAYGAGQNHNFVIAYNLVEKLNITPTGEFGIGTATPTSRFDIRGAKPTAGGGNGFANDAASQAIIADGSGGASYQNDWPVGWGGGLATWDICGQGAFFTLYNTRSDRRLKKDITDMNQSIEINFMKLRPVTYLLKKETPEINGTQYGFIAQEVAELFPTLVTKDKGLEGSTIGMNYQGLIAPTIHVVQEQQKKIELQQTQIAELLKRIEALEKK